MAFVSDSCPGDTVEASLTGEHARHVTARTVRVVDPSADRVKPPCPYFDACGGCQWQHVGYEAQLDAKRDIVVDALRRIGGLENADSLVADTVASPEQYGYRNKIELAAEWSPTGLLLGYRGRASRDIVSVDSCLLLPRSLKAAPKALRGALRYLSGSQDLGIERVGLRVAANTRDVEVALWTAPSAFPRAAAAKTIAAAVQASSVVRVMTREDGHARDVAGVEVLRGKGAWKERLDGRSMLVSAPSFFQVNTKAAELLVRLVISSLAPTEHEAVLDMYCGAGTFTLPLAEHAGETVGVESSRFALTDLRRNAEQADLPVEIVPGDAARVIEEIGEFDVVVVDPPRAGLAPEAVTALAATNASRVAYVSCDPATLARDVKRLAAVGYGLQQAVPVDLFPQSYHVETFALLERTDADAQALL